MSDSRFDVLVLGAGMVGSATAAALALRGVKVALVDRGAPGEGTSYGNAGVIDQTAFVPTAFPRDPATLISFLLKRKPHLNYDLAFLPKVAGWLFAYWRNAAPEKIAESAARLAPLALKAVESHHRLAAAAGSSALIRDTGWMHIYRTEAGYRSEMRDHDLIRSHGVGIEIVEGERLAALEPHLSSVASKASWVAGASTSDPGQLTKSYADLAVARGGRFVQADARGLMRRAEGFVLATETGVIAADQVVVALGPWAKEFLSAFSIDVPIAVKRGYHMHFSARGNATLSRPVTDIEGGYSLTPTTRGIRMTTGAEFADRDAPPSPRQVDAAEVMARELFPLDRRVEPEPWLGRRPNTPDGVPIIGQAPGQPGMWLAVGHGHWGLGLGAATGELVADLVTGATPMVDPAPLGIARYG